MCIIQCTEHKASLERFIIQETRLEILRYGTINCRVMLHVDNGLVLEESLYSLFIYTHSYVHYLLCQ